MDDVQTISKMSNLRLRCAQSTAETPNHSEKAETKYLRGVQMTAMTNWKTAYRNSCTGWTGDHAPV